MIFVGRLLGARGWGDLRLGGCLDCDLGDLGGMGCDFFGATLGARGWGDLRWGDV